VRPKRSLSVFGIAQGFDERCDARHDNLHKRGKAAFGLQCLRFADAE
jgi:hypothetical protein